MRSLLVPMVLALLTGCSSIASVIPFAGDNGPQHIILFVGDGMGINTLTAARIYAVGETGDLAIDRLPEAAFVKTYSNNFQVTDNAAAMSALLTGEKADSGVLAMRGCADGAPMPAATLLELARARGMSTGLVTNVAVTDTLNAAGYSHACADPGGDVAAAALVPGGAGYNGALGRGLNVLLGGGARHFAKRADGRDLLAELRAQQYVTVASRAEMDSAELSNHDRLAGLFAPGDLAWDAERDPAQQPSLAQMTAQAIARLRRNGSGFVLVVSNGLVDRAQHASQARRAVEEVAALDQALQTALDAMQRIDPGLKRTLIVATATHDSTLVLNGYSKRTGPTTATEPGVLGVLKNYATGKPSTDLDGAPYTVIGYGNGTNRTPGARSAGTPLTDAIVTQPDYRYEAAVRMAPDATTHGGIDVFLGAAGAQADTFRGTIDNTRVFQLIKAAGGL